MYNLLIELEKAFKGVLSDSFFQKNTAKTVNYPYLTYSYQGEPLRERQDGFYIDVDVFDNLGVKNVARIEKTTGLIIREMRDFTLLTDDFLIRFEYKGSNPIPTGSNELERRNIQLYCKVDWRN